MFLPEDDNMIPSLKIYSFHIQCQTVNFIFIYLFIFQTVNFKITKHRMQINIELQYA